MAKIVPVTKISTEEKIKVGPVSINASPGKVLYRL